MCYSFISSLSSLSHACIRILSPSITGAALSIPLSSHCEGEITASARCIRKVCRKTDKPLCPASSILQIPSYNFHPASFLTFGRKPAHTVHWTGKKYSHIITHVNCIIHPSSSLSLSLALPTASFTLIFILQFYFNLFPLNKYLRGTSFTLD